jgi:polyhydroxyalkanoate synthesis regulator protein
MTSKRNRSAAHIHEHTLVEFMILTVLCLLLLAIQTCSSAHPRNSGQMRRVKSPEEIISILKDRLHLSEEQVAEVKPIIEEACQKRTDIMESYTGREARNSMRTEMQELEKETEAKLSTVLRSDQMGEYRKPNDGESQPARHSKRSH